MQLRMEEPIYSRKQFGRDALLTIFSLEILASGLIWFFEEPPQRWIALVLIWAILIPLLAIVYDQKVEVSNEEVKVKQGFGWISNQIATSNIKGVDLVTQLNFFNGYGFRLGFGGSMLYRVSGSTAVRLRQKIGPDIIIGTDDPQGLLRAVDTALQKSNSRDLKP